MGSGDTPGSGGGRAETRTGSAVGEPGGERRGAGGLCPGRDCPGGSLGMGGGAPGPGSGGGLLPGSGGGRGERIGSPMGELDGKRRGPGKLWIGSGVGKVGGAPGSGGGRGETTGSTTSELGGERRGPGGLWLGKVGGAPGSGGEPPPGRGGGRCSVLAAGAPRGGSHGMKGVVTLLRRVEAASPRVSGAGLPPVVPPVSPSIILLTPSVIWSTSDSSESAGSSAGGSLFIIPFLPLLRAFLPRGEAPARPTTMFANPSSSIAAAGWSGSGSGSGPGSGFRVRVRVQGQWSVGRSGSGSGSGAVPGDTLCHVAHLRNPLVGRTICRWPPFR